MEEIRKNIKDCFNELVFEEKPHKYYVGGRPIEKSVSTLIKEFATPFDEQLRSKRKAERIGVPQEHLLREWHNKRDRAIYIGKQAHLFGELYAFNRNLRPQSQRDIGIMKFWNDLPDYVIPIIAEQPMYHKKRFYAGTPDGILLNIQIILF